METVKLEINGKDYEVIVAETEEQRVEGLQNVIEMDDNEGLLMVWPSHQNIEIWMKDTDIPLDIIFINSDWTVKSVFQGQPNTEDVMSDNAQFVLELNQSSGVKSGDEIILDDPEEWYEELETNSMYIIGEDGKPAYTLEGGERIFSRPNTQTLVKMAKRAFLSEKESDYKRLGRKVFEYLTAQDSRPAEYVQSPEEKKSDD